MEKSARGFLDGRALKHTPQAPRQFTDTGESESETLARNRREPARDFGVRFDRDALGYKVFLDHLDEIGTLLVFGMAARGEPIRVEVGLTV